MKHTTLGRNGPTVSALCLGSMTWGSQNTEAEGHAQIERALAAGVNFIDTAEMYPANPGPNDQPGATEAIIGSWLAKSGRREEIVLASKITGEGSQRARAGVAPTPPITPAEIEKALDASLKRLRTDHIDLYQLHWPNRGSYHFRRYWGWTPPAHDPARERQEIADILGALDRAIDAGKIGHVGLSNETAWGLMLFLEVAERHALPRVVSIQNEYSLLCRLFDLDLGEICMAEGVSLLAYSPLATGILSGKYAGDKTPPNTRRALNATLNGRITPQLWPAHDAYLDLAKGSGLDPAAMALAFCLSRPFMGAAIFGATSLDQLDTALSAASLTLTEEQSAAIEAIHRRFPAPI
ncbi:aldo/keto reductase [Pikeienuella sp. HZG-20]|uniref:aldo/keto reductase n=1 Tax=Paludibacillus litoralis TaxID=3133267 RepID=UPI0030EEBD7E